jgi:hypothetical protein
MIILEKVRKFLTNDSEVSFGYNGLTFLSADKLDDGQIGYSVDSKGNSLITGQEGDWKKEWLVIGTDTIVGDPIFIDTSSKQLQVLTAGHGEGEWECITIADSLDNFADIISELKKVSVKRTTPIALEKNPLPEKERNQFIQKVGTDNSETEIYYWENFLGDE